MNNDKIPEILTAKQLAEKIAEAVANKIPNTTSEAFKGLPICRTDFYRLRSGDLTLSLKTLYKVCQWLGFSTPKFFL